MGGRGPPDIGGMISLKVDNLTYRTTQDDVRDLVGFSLLDPAPPLASDYHRLAYTSCEALCHDGVSHLSPISAPRGGAVTRSG
jgi:hypothetical protein